MPVLYIPFIPRGFDLAQVVDILSHITGLTFQMEGRFLHPSTPTLPETVEMFEKLQRGIPVKVSLNSNSFVRICLHTDNPDI